MEERRPFTLGLMILVMVATASGSMDSLCPPAFIDMESFFAKSLQQSEQMRTMFDNFKLVNSRPDNCRYSEGILGNIDLFNAGRCQRDDDVEVICTTTTTSTTTTTTTTTTPEPTPAPTPSTVKTSPHVNSPEWSTSLTSSTSSKNPIMTSAPPRPVPQPSSPEDEWTTHSGNGDSTTTAKGKLEPGEPGKITPGDKNKGENSVADKVSGSNPNENHTIYYVVGGAVALIIVVLISLIVVCRNQSSAGGDRKKRLLRQRSDLQPINSIQDDMSRSSSVTDPGSWRYSRSGQRGKKWRPHYSSENSSEVGSMKSTKMLLREESRQSTSSTEFRFNTLKQLEHPNAIVLGGFGETSTDYTLSRNGTLPNGNGTLPNGNGTLPNGNGTLPNGNHNTTVEMNGEAETKFDYDQPKLCVNGYDNPAMSKCSSFDSVDRAIDDWKNSLNANGMPEEELVNSQNEMMFSYENKAAEFDIPTEPAESVANDTAVEVPKDAPVSVTIDTGFTTPIESSKPPISNSTSNMADVIKPAEESNVVSEISSPNNNAPVAVVHPTKRLSVKDRISMFEGEKTNTLQAKSANGVVANGYNNNKFHSLPRKLEKPSAHVQPQQVIIQDRDADVML